MFKSWLPGRTRARKPQTAPSPSVGQPKHLCLGDLWINILPRGGTHARHLHPHSVVSGTTYVSMPDGASALKLEDPRSARMMAAPARVTFNPVRGPSRATLRSDDKLLAGLGAS